MFDRTRTDTIRGESKDFQQALNDANWFNSCNLSKTIYETPNLFLHFTARRCIKQLENDYIRVNRV